MDESRIVQSASLGRLRETVEGTMQPVAAAATLAVLLGAALRLREYEFERSFWLDELSLVDNVIARGFVALTKPLALEQAAPIGYLWLIRASARVFGVNELSLRLVAVLGGLVALVIFARLAWLVLPPLAALAAIVLFSLNPKLIFYSTEVKQYSTDVMAAVALVYSTVRLPPRPSRAQAMRFALLAASLVWLSQSAILVAASCGLVIAGRSVRRPRDVVPLVPAGLVISASVLLEYVVSLRRQASDQVLKRYWAAGFPPSEGRASVWLHGDLRSVLSDPFGMHSADLSLLLAVLGLVTLALRRSWAAALTSSSLVLAISLAFADVYPLRQRLALYLEPVVILLIAAGLAWVPSPRRLGRDWKGAAWMTRSAVSALVAAALVVTAGPSVASSLRIFPHPIDITAGRQAVAFVASRERPGDLVYSEAGWAAQTIGYYGPKMHVGQNGSFNWVPGSASPCRQPQFPANATRVWLVFAHRASTFPLDRAQIYLSLFSRAGTIEDSFSGYGGAGAYLLDLTKPPARPEPARSLKGAPVCVSLGRADGYAAV